MEGIDIQGIVRTAVREFLADLRFQVEPAYKAELQEERRPEHLAEKAEISSAVRVELQRLGVVKAGVLSRGIEADVQRTEDGALVVVEEPGKVTPIRVYLRQFVEQNPEFLQKNVESLECEARLRANAAMVARMAEDIVRVASQPGRGLI